MTDTEYLSQRKELENRISQLDAAHLNDREYLSSTYKCNFLGADNKQ